MCGCTYEWTYLCVYVFDMYAYLCVCTCVCMVFLRTWTRLLPPLLNFFCSKNSFCHYLRFTLRIRAALNNKIVQVKFSSKNRSKAPNTVSANPCYSKRNTIYHFVVRVRFKIWTPIGTLDFLYLENTLTGFESTTASLLPQPRDQVPILETKFTAEFYTAPISSALIGWNIFE